MKNKSKLYYEDLKNEVNNKLFSARKNLKGRMEKMASDTFKEKRLTEEFAKNIFPYFVQFNNMDYDPNEKDLTKYQFLIQKQKC